MQVTNNGIKSLNSVLDYKQKKKLAKKKRRLKKQIKLLLIILIIISFSLIYFMTSLSNVKSITVSGNIYLTDSEIVELTSLDLNSKFLLINDKKVANTLIASPFMADATVEKSGLGDIKVAITEKKIAGYVYDSETKLYFTDGTYTVLTDEKLSLIANGPIFIDLSDDMLEKASIAFDDISMDVIKQMSEVTLHVESYDAEMLQILMSNDKYLFTSLQATTVLNSYFDLSKYLTASDECIYIDELSGHAYSKACPWDENEVSEDIMENDELETSTEN